MDILFKSIIKILQPKPNRFPAHQYSCARGVLWCKDCLTVRKHLLPSPMVSLCCIAGTCDNYIADTPVKGDLILVMPLLPPSWPQSPLSLPQSPSPLFPILPSPLSPTCLLYPLTWARDFWEDTGPHHHFQWWKPGHTAPHVAFCNSQKACCTTRTWLRVA